MDRVRGHVRSWARDTFSRESLLSSFRTFLWVVPLTVLIWIYAEREELIPAPHYMFKVEPANNDPTRLVRITDASGGNVVADLLAPHGRLEQAEQALAAGPVPIKIDNRLEPGTHKISASIIANESLFEQYGVTLSNIQPADLTITVDLIRTISIPVQPRPEDQARLDSGYSFEPHAVQLSAPESFLSEHPKLVAWAALSNLDAPGPHTETAPIVPSAGGDPQSHVKIITPNNKAEVIAKYTVRNKDVSTTLASMPVWHDEPALPDNFWGTHHVVYTQTSVSGIRVTGPEELLSKLASSPPKATFEVTVDPAGPFPSSGDAKLHFVLPSGVTTTDSVTIHYTVVENRAGAGE
jgi:hypothetical protein